jgi:hypothetical protein
MSLAVATVTFFSFGLQNPVDAKSTGAESARARVPLLNPLSHDCGPTAKGVNGAVNSASLIACYQDSIATIRDQLGDVPVDKAVSTLDSRLTAFNKRLESTLSPEQYTIAASLLSSYRLVIKSLEAIGVQSAPETSRSPLWASHFVGITTTAIKALLYAGLIWCIATQGSIFLCSLLVTLLVLLDFAIWNATKIVKTWHHRPISNSDAIEPTVALSELETEMRSLAFQIDFILKKSDQQSIEINELNESLRARSSHLQVGEIARVFQKVYGLCERDHPELRDLVKGLCVDGLQDEGLALVRYEKANETRDYFDAQHSCNTSQTRTIELYPAIIHQSSGELVLRGRIICPRP